MNNFFLDIVNMSITASWIVLAVLVVRLLLKKAPKWINVVLWGMVGIRLVFPFSLESIFSLIPSTQTIVKEQGAFRPYVQSGVPIVDNGVNEYLQSTYYEGVTRPTGHFLDVTTILAIIWLTGVALLVVYSIFSYLRLKGKVATAVPLQDNVFQSENVGSPFVLGIFRPKIYLPFAINQQDAEQVIAHETAHIGRRDYLWKPLGFLLLILHWFNPLLWVGYVLLCRDIELACDEKVIKNLDDIQKADYSQALLHCSVHRRLIAACPLAFGEVSVKDRVKSVLHYKKPAFWVVVIAVVVSVAVGVCFLTNPATVKLQDIEGYGIRGRVSETTSVMVTTTEGYQYLNDLEKDTLQPLFDLKISAKEVSENRSEERDTTHTVIINIPEESPPMYSYVPGIGIHFNKDFTEVWASDSNNQGHDTFSYQVKNPQKAKEVFTSLMEQNGSSISTVGGADEPESVVTSVPEAESTPSQQQGETSSQGTVSTVSKPQKESSVPASSKTPVESSQPTSSQNTSSVYEPTYFESLSRAKTEEISACVEKDNYEYGENQYFGTYNGYHVLLVSQINGVETEDAQPLKIAGYEFLLGKTERLIAYKDGSYILLSQAYTNGVITKQAMKNIHYLYRFKFDYLIDYSELYVCIKVDKDEPEKEYSQEDFPGIAIKSIEKETWFSDYEGQPCDIITITLPFENRRNVMNVAKTIDKMDNVFFAEPAVNYYPA